MAFHRVEVVRRGAEVSGYVSPSGVTNIQVRDLKSPGPPGALSKMNPRYDEFVALLKEHDEKCRGCG